MSDVTPPEGLSSLERLQWKRDNFHSVYGATGPVLPDVWYANHTTLVSVASFAVDRSEFLTPQEVVDFFEKPWQYPELYAEYVESIDVESAEQESSWRMEEE